MKPKVLILDIETAPMVAYVWGLRDQNVALNQIKSDWYVIAWAAKWLGDPASTTLYQDQRKAKNIQNDKELIEPLWQLLNQADYVITQNGRNFDGPKLNARFIEHGFPPPSPYKHVDTYQIVRRVAKFSSNKLEYLTQKLCVKYKKLSHKKFPGFSLWTECLAGNLAAWNEMKRYNIHDVLATEEFYTKIRAWAPSTMADVYEDRAGCLVCGGNLQRRGSAAKRGKLYHRLQCRSCGKWTQGGLINGH